MITFDEDIVYPPPSLPTTPDPCPFCQHRAADEYSLLFHIENQHTDDSPFALRNSNDETTDSEDMYVKCPEPGCEELLRLMELQNHMDFHEAEAVADDNGEAPRKKRSSHHKREGRDQQHGREHRERRHRDKERDGRDGRDDGKHRHRERDSRGRGEKRREVMFIAPPATLRRARSPAKSGLSWFERAALAIYPVHTPREPPPGRRRSWSRGAERSRRRSHSRGAEERSSRVEQDVTVRRSKSDASSHRHRHRSERGREKSKPGTIKKLGKSDLGPYANEMQMPSWLHARLAQGGKAITVRKIDPATGRLMNVVQISNETPDLIQTLSLLLYRDPHVQKAWLCHPGIKHVGKQTQKEGGFCGYRNIQMLISYVQAAYPRGRNPFEGRIPTILKLQDMIEEGWAQGINSSARLETGGIRGTRKYIGTSEAQTLFTAAGILSEAKPFSSPQDLLDYVEEYFSSASATTGDDIVGTQKPPIYLQHSGHSMTIVGLEKYEDGSRSLLVFDPFFAPNDSMKSLAGAKRIGSKVKWSALLRAYRRGMTYLGKYNEFEVIVLNMP